MIIDDLPVVVDTREQLPYAFPGAIRGTLKTGDYSLVGMEDRVTVERKSLADLFGTLRNGEGRDRFKRELKRMSEMEAACVVVEASLDEVLEGPPLSRLNPYSVVNTLIAWAIRYGVSVWFAGSRENAAAVTYRFLQHFVRIAGERA